MIVLLFYTLLKTEISLVGFLVWFVGVFLSLDSLFIFSFYFYPEINGSLSVTERVLSLVHWWLVLEPKKLLRLHHDYQKKLLVSMIVFFCFLHSSSDFRMTLVNFAGKWRAKTSFWDDSTKDSEATWRDDALCAWHSLGGLWRKFKHGSYKWHVTRSPLILKIFLLLGEHHQNQNLCPYVE